MGRLIIGVFLRFSVFFVVLLIILSTYASARPRLPASFHLSEIINDDISQQLSYVSIGQAQLPNFSSQINTWLTRFPERNMGDHFKDRYVTVFDVYNDTKIQQWFIYPSGSVVEKISIHLFSEEGPAQSFVSGHGLINQQALHYGSQLSIKPGEQKRVLMVFSSDFFFAPLKITLQPLAQSKQLFAAENVVLLLSLGICLALGIYNLFIYFVTRVRLYLFYALSTGFYTLGWSAVFAVFEFTQWASLSMWLMPAFLLGAAFSALFHIEFLHLQVTSPIITKFYWMLALGCCLSLPFAFYSQAVGLILVSLLSSAILLIGLYAGSKAWCSGYKPARYFVAALICLTLPNIVSNLLNLHILDSVNLNIYLLGLVGVALDTLILAFALAEKVRLVNYRNHELNTQLEQTVEFRTRALEEANDQLALINTDLVEASAAKGRFLANMSHEIRTPLTSIIGYADGILLGDIDKAEQQRVTKIIHDNGEHLLQVINGILDISKIDANKLDYESLPTDLFTLLADIESMVSKRARDKGLAFHLHYQFPLPNIISTDPTRLKQILFNLTGNALKFTQQGHIGLEVSTQDQQLVIKVTDSGEGISAGQLKTLFTPFTQADSSINRRFGGTGLGLSISRSLAQGLGGELTVQSQLRKGSTFILKMNLLTAKNCNWVTSVSQVEQALRDAATQNRALPIFANSRVLLADDHPNNRELIALLLRRMEIDVTEVENGQQALEVVFYHKFDLILLDIHMPQLNGLEALKQIREAGNQTPVVALTANNMKHEIAFYLRAGFNDHLAKPIERDVFLYTISRYLTPSNVFYSTPVNQNMQGLIQDYCKDLARELDALQHAWLSKDLHVVSEIAHKIKGSASSFGFSVVGVLFADIERLALRDDELALAETLPKALRFGNMCLSLPGVNIAQAIVSYRNKSEDFLQQLPAIISQSEICIDKALLGLGRGDLKDASLSLQPLGELFTVNGLSACRDQLAMLLTLIQEEIAQYTDYLQHTDTLRRNLQSITVALKQSETIDYSV